jgi:putative hydrolase of the HAD superfamily
VSTPQTIDAVLFDFGGVITTSPFEAFNRYEAELGIPLDTIRTINATNPDDNAWARMERNEVTVEEFSRLFEDEASAVGHQLSGTAVLGCLSGDVRPQMVRALDILAARVRIGCITNNMRQSRPGSRRDVTVRSGHRVLQSGPPETGSPHLRTGLS